MKIKKLNNIMHLKINKTNGKTEAEYHSLNEFVIDRGSKFTVIKINVYLNDIFLTKF